MHHNKKNTNIDIEGIDEVITNLPIKNINEKAFFNKKVYCRALINVHTPHKDTSAAEKDTSEKTDEARADSGSPLLKQKIPGLPEAEVKKAERKKAKDKKKNDKKAKEKDIKTLDGLS